MEFAPSKILLKCLIFIVMISNFIIWHEMERQFAIVWGIGSMAATYWAYFDPYFIHKIEFDEQHRAIIFTRFWASQANVLSGSFATPFLCILHWQTDSRTIVQWILPDSTDRESFRRLRLWLRFEYQKTT